MILDLYQIGKAVSQDHSELSAMVLDFSKFKLKTKKGQPLPKPQAQPLRFNLDFRTVELPELIRLRDDPQQLWDLGAVRFGAPRGRKHYPAVLFPKNITQLEAGLFNGQSGTGDLMDWAGDAADEELALVLNELALLRPRYEEMIAQDKAGIVGLLKKRSTLEYPIVLIYVTVSWSTKGWEDVPLARIGNFQSLYRQSRTTGGASATKLCYFTGKPAQGVTAPNSKERFNLNKIFVTTTTNYAPGFEKEDYEKGFRINSDDFAILEAGSEYLLNGGKLSYRIADVSHVVFPRVIGADESILQDEAFLREIDGVMVSLFSYQSLDQLETGLFDISDDRYPYSLTFLAYDSDGNSTKVISEIKEVGSFHFQRITKNLEVINYLFRPWLGKQVLNLYSLFDNLPIVKDTTRNIGLELLGSLLENRSISERKLYEYFTEVVLCHHYGRYKAYAHPRTFGDREAIWGIRDAVIHYAALRLLLRQLGQLQNENMSAVPSPAEILQSITPLQNEIAMAEDHESYFQQLGYTQRQRSLFYLGQALSRVAYEQERKDNRRSILDAVDFSGMDKRKLTSLALAIMDKAKVYRLENSKQTVLEKIQWSLNKFYEGFDVENWDHTAQFEGREPEKPVDAKQAVFFLMAGYTYGAKAKSKSSEEKSPS